MPETSKKIDNPIADKIVKTLDESNIGLVRRVVEILGEERSLAFLQRTMEIEANGGMQTAGDSTRRRTAGGVFFYLIKEELTPEEYKQVFPKPEKSKVAPPQPAKLVSWDVAVNEIRSCAKLPAHEKGELWTVKMTVVGRPKSIRKLENCVALAMQPRPAPALPKGLPNPGNATVGTIVVFVANRQWSKVEPYLLQDSKDGLVIEGYPVFTPKEGGTALLATNIISIAQQRQAREQKGPRHA